MPGIPFSARLAIYVQLAWPIWLCLVTGYIWVAVCVHTKLPSAASGAVLVSCSVIAEIFLGQLRSLQIPVTIKHLRLWKAPESEEIYFEQADGLTIESTTYIPVYKPTRHKHSILLTLYKISGYQFPFACHSKNHIVKATRKLTPSPR